MSDEERMGFKAVNILAGPFRLRVFSQPDFAHRSWNDFGNAVDSSKLRSCILKCTLLCNWRLGPFNTGTHQQKLEDAARHLMSTCTDEFLADMSDQVALDNCMESYDLTREEWVQVCTRRITKVLGIESNKPFTLLLSHKYSEN